MASSSKHWKAICCTLLACASCATTTKTTSRVVSPRDVEAAAEPPVINDVRDLGSPRIHGRKEISTIGHDGVAVIGELLFIRGEGFGRRPRVSIDGRTTIPLVRVDDGVVVRVPWGVRPGSRRVEVHNSRGHAATTFPLQRYALATVPSKDAIYAFAITRDGIQRASLPITFPGARIVRYSADGRIAYVSGRERSGELKIATVDMIHRGGPEVANRYAVPGKQLIALAAAEQAPLAVALSDTHVVLIDTRDPARPALYRPMPRPAELDSVIAADMDPRGRLLAALCSKGNELRLFDVSRAGQLRLLAKARVLPKARRSLVHDLQFASDAKTIWVISGDNLRTLWHGRHRLRLTVIKIAEQSDTRSHSLGVLSVWRSLDVPYRAAPVDLAVARGQPLASGRTVAVPPQNAAVFITAHATRLLRLHNARFDDQRGLKRAARMLRGIKPLGTVVRTNITGSGGPMYASDSLLGAIDITSDSQLLLVAGARVEVTQSPASVKLVYGISSCPVFGKVKPQFIPLAKVDPESLARPFLLGDVRVQP